MAPPNTNPQDPGSPLENPSPELTGAPSTPEFTAKTPGPLRFLVVDDTADIRDLVVDMIEHLGHTAHQAADGVEAVELLAVHRYDLMLLDLTMPRMSGDDVVRWLAEHPDSAHGLRVVVVSALAADHRANLHELGVHAVLPKPLGAQQLRDLISDTPSDMAH